MTFEEIDERYREAALDGDADDDGWDDPEAVVEEDDLDGPEDMGEDHA